MADILSRQANLRLKLSSALEDLEASLRKSGFDFDVIVSHCEINKRHGVGVLLQRIFPIQKDILSIRSTNLYDEQQTFGGFNLCLSCEGLSRSEMLAKVKRSLGRKKPKRILSIPYFTDDVLTTLALKELSDVPLCTYLMDDQNIYVNNISDGQMRELLQKSDLCLGISRELCQAYAEKYNCKFWFLPPVVEEKFIQKQLQTKKLAQDRQGILVGNIWSQQWLEKLRTVIRDSGTRVDWYGNPNRVWLSFQEQDLNQDGITFHGYCSEELLIEQLRKASYAIVPTGTTNQATDRPELACLSLPSRIPYILATSNTPIIVLGRRDSAAAQFVEQLQIGVACDYDVDSFCQAVEYICSPPVQQRMRQRAASLAQVLSADTISEWIWQSLDKGEPCDLRFEQLGKIADADAIITLDEVNQRHGTGALVKRIFADSTNILSIRSNNHYGGEHYFGDVSLCLSQKGLSRPEVFQSVLQALNGMTVKRVFCIPYHCDEILSAIAIKELFGVPLATYIMDDQNICVNNIPDDLMREFLSKCSFRLATHAELRDAYEEKYGFKFWILPAIIPDNLIQNLPQSPQETLCQSKTGALVGSIWSEKWFNMLRDTIIGAGVNLDWYGNNQYWWLKDSPEQLKEQGINPHGILAESQLAKTLSKYPYVIVPTGTLDERDDRPELSHLSLPGRIIFILATSNTPVILLGSEETSPARFIKRFQTGVVCDYSSQSLRDAVNYVTNTTVQQEMRRRAAAVAKDFSDRGVNEWIWKSLSMGEPWDLRFEKLMSRPLTDNLK